MLYARVFSARHFESGEGPGDEVGCVLPNGSLRSAVDFLSVNIQNGGQAVLRRTKITKVRVLQV